MIIEDINIFRKAHQYLKAKERQKDLKKLSGKESKMKE